MRKILNTYENSSQENLSDDKPLSGKTAELIFRKVLEEVFDQRDEQQQELIDARRKIEKLTAENGRLTEENGKLKAIIIEINDQRLPLSQNEDLGKFGITDKDIYLLAGWLWIKWTNLPEEEMQKLKEDRRHVGLMRLNSHLTQTNRKPIKKREIYIECCKQAEEMIRKGVFKPVPELDREAEADSQRYREMQNQLQELKEKESIRKAGNVRGGKNKKLGRHSPQIKEATEYLEENSWIECAKKTVSDYQSWREQKGYKKISYSAAARHLREAWNFRNNP